MSQRTTMGARTSCAVRAFSAVVAGAILGGCQVGPDVAAPDLLTRAGTDWSTSAGAGGTPGVHRPPEDLTEWWSRFDDPELSRLIGDGLRGNLGLVEVRERITAARARRGIENAGRRVRLDGRASYERQETGDDAFSFGGTPSGAGVDLYTAGVVADWELDLWGRVGRLVEAADADIAEATWDLRAARVALAARIARDVMAIRAIDADLGAVRADVDARRDTLSIAESRSAAGFAAEVDVTRARRQLEATRAVVPRLEGERRAAELRLAALIGVRPGDLVVTVADLPTPAFVPSLGVPADLLRRRPDIRQAEAAWRASRARIGARMAERYPRFSLGGSLNLQGPSAGDVVNSSATVLGIGPSISVPILDGGRIRARISEAESAERSVRARLESVVLDAVGDVEVAAVQRRQAAERRERLAAAERSARRTESLSVDRYQAGRSDFLAVTEATGQRLSIERQRIEAQRDELLRLIDLYAALGGGWEGERVALAADGGGEFGRRPRRPDGVNPTASRPCLSRLRRFRRAAAGPEATRRPRPARPAR